MAANLSNDSQAIYDLLAKAQVIALVGHSDKPERDSYRVAAYLREAGYTVYPVNPTVEQIDGRQSYRKVQHIPEPVDIVDVFRGKRHIPGIVQDAIEAGAGAVWMQIELGHDEAAQTALENGLDVVINRCIQIEHARLRVPKKERTNRS